MRCPHCGQEIQTFQGFVAPQQNAAANPLPIIVEKYDTTACAPPPSLMWRVVPVS